MLKRWTGAAVLAVILNRSLGNKPLSLTEFILQAAKLNGGDDFDRAFLEGMYDRVIQASFIGDEEPAGAPQSPSPVASPAITPRRALTAT